MDIVDSSGQQRRRPRLQGVKLADFFVADPAAAGKATKAAPEIEGEPGLILRQAVGGESRRSDPAEAVVTVGTH
jgi:hypothetical protein